MARVGMYRGIRSGFGVAAAMTAAALGLAGCRDTTQRQVPDKQPAREDRDDDANPTDQTATGTATTIATGTVTGTGTGVDPLRPVVDVPEVEPVFPQLELAATGTTRCKEAMATTSRVRTALTATELTVNRVEAHMDCPRDNIWLQILLGVSTCDQQQLDDRIRAEVLGSTRYERPTAEHVRQLRASGVELPRYAVLATAITTNKGVTWRLDRPLPVMPWPGPMDRFAPLATAPQTFTAQASGPVALKVGVAIRQLERSGDLVKLQFDLTLNDSQDHRLYDVFPLPRTAVYTVNVRTQDYQEMKVTDWISEKSCEADGQVELNYRLCRKLVNGQLQNFGC